MAKAKDERAVVGKPAAAFVLEMIFIMASSILEPSLFGLFGISEYVTVALVARS